MGIHAALVKNSKEEVVAINVQVTDPVNIQIFQRMIHRAVNLWPDAPADIKHFADIVTHGHPMQDYFSNPNLSGSPKPL